MMQLVRDGAAVPFLVESQAHEGVRRVAGKVAEDVRRVSGALPQIISAPEGDALILCATLGCSPLADALIAAAETLPFMGEKRLVVVRECLCRHSPFMMHGRQCVKE